MSELDLSTLAKLRHLRDLSMQLGSLNAAHLSRILANKSLRRRLVGRLTSDEVWT